ncbi:MAG: hypothetical protein JXR03_20310 [Cyclobacteriaceae bacterium]
MKKLYSWLIISASVLLLNFSIVCDFNDSIFFSTLLYGDGKAPKTYRVVLNKDNATRITQRNRLEMKEYLKWNFIPNKHEIYADDVHVIGWKNNVLAYSTRVMIRSWLFVLIFNAIYFLAVLIDPSLVFPTSMLLFPWVSKNLNIPDPVISIVAIALGYLIIQKLRKNGDGIHKVKT